MLGRARLVLLRMVKASYLIKTNYVDATWGH
jgi:hypothetical protein